MDQVMRGHDTAGEEMLGDPVGLVAMVEAIGPVAMSEDVHEEAAVRLQPGACAGQEFVPIGHVLEHLDRDNAVELSLRVEFRHVGGADGKILEAARLGHALDMRALRSGVRNRNDAGIGEVLGHVERQRPPTAAEFENGLAIDEAGILDGALQRGDFRLIERFAGVFVETAGIFTASTERQAEELCRHFIMLLVCLVRMNGDGISLHRFEEHGLFGIADILKAAAGTTDQKFHTRGGQPVGKVHPLGCVDDVGDHGHFTVSLKLSGRGGPGKKALTRA